MLPQGSWCQYIRLLQMILREHAHKVVLRCTAHPRTIAISELPHNFPKGKGHISRILRWKTPYWLYNVFNDPFNSMEIERSFLIIRNLCRLENVFTVSSMSGWTVLRLLITWNVLYRTKFFSVRISPRQCYRRRYLGSDDTEIERLNNFIFV